jgi:transposase
MSRRREAEPTGKLPLTERQRNHLLQTLHHTSDARLYRRLLALVQLDRGKPVEEVAQLVDAGRTSIYRWLQRFLAEADPQAVRDRPGRGRPRLVDASLLHQVEQALEAPPGRFGYLETGWTLPLLCEHLERVSDKSISTATLRRSLRAADFVYKRPRYRLEPDPEYEKKSRPYSCR